MFLEEDEVYIGTKCLLSRYNWQLIAGQPPDGCDHLPVVEIKLPTRRDIGSRGAYKPDLVALKNGHILLVECKPAYSASDETKLQYILSDSERLKLLWMELLQRHLVTDRMYENAFQCPTFRTWGALAFSVETCVKSQLALIHVSNMEGNGNLVPPTLPHHLSQNEFDVLFPLFMP